MYKDKDKQREANKERQKRYKARQKGVTSEGVTEKALLVPYDRTPKGLAVGVKGLEVFDEMPAKFLPGASGPTAKDFHSLPPDVQRSIMRISEDDEEIRGRTIIALDYQRQFPNNIHRGTGL